MVAESPGPVQHPHPPAVESTGTKNKEVRPQQKTAAARAEIPSLTPHSLVAKGERVAPSPCGSLSRGHPLTGQGMVTFNWLMSGEHFEDEKGQVAIITVHFLR